MNIEFANMAIPAYVVHVLAVIVLLQPGSPVSAQRTSRHGSRVTLREQREIVVYPARSRMNVQLVNMPIGSYIVHVLASVETPVSVQRRARRRQHRALRQHRQVVVLPASFRLDVKLANVSVYPNEVHMLVAAVSRVPVQRTPCHGSGAVSRKLRQIVMYPFLFRTNEEFVNVTIRSDEVHMLLAAGTY